MPKKSEKKPKAEKPSSKPEAKKLSKEEFEKKVVELAKEGITAEKIGEKLRREGIHPKEHEKISRVLKRNKVYVNPDLKNVKEKLDRVTKHWEKNKQDKRAMRDKDRIASEIRLLGRYHAERVQ